MKVKFVWSKIDTKNCNDLSGLWVGIFFIVILKRLCFEYFPAKNLSKKSRKEIKQKDLYRVILYAVLF